MHDETDSERRRVHAKRSDRVTLRDVAAAVGVSAMTVSNVVNGRSEDVSEATRLRVNKAIEDLNYRIHRGGRGLRAASRNAVGLLVSDASPNFLSDPFTANLVAGLSNGLSAADHTLTIQGVSPQTLGNSLLVKQLVVDGLCVVLSGDKQARHDALRTLTRLNQPLVVFQESLTFSAPDTCVVREDDEFGGRLIAGHLMSKGHRSILAVLPRTEWPALESRLTGLCSAFEDAHYAASVEVLRSASEEFTDVQQALSSYLLTNWPPDAVVGANDRMALAAMALLQDRGNAIPGDVGVVGFNGFEFTRYARPALTTVISPAYQMGETAAKLMLDRLAGEAFPEREIVFAVSLSPGASA